MPCAADAASLGAEALRATLGLPDRRDVGRRDQEDGLGLLERESVRDGLLGFCDPVWE